MPLEGKYLWEDGRYEWQTVCLLFFPTRTQANLFGIDRTDLATHLLKSAAHPTNVYDLKMRKRSKLYLCAFWSRTIYCRTALQSKSFGLQIARFVCSYSEIMSVKKMSHSQRQTWEEILTDCFFFPSDSFLTLRIRSKNRNFSTTIELYEAHPWNREVWRFC